MTISMNALTLHINAPFMPLVTILKVLTGVLVTLDILETDLSVEKRCGKFGKEVIIINVVPVL